MTNPGDEHDDATARLAGLMHARVDGMRPDLHARAASALRVGRRLRRRRRAGSALGAVAVVAAVGSFGYVVAASGGPESSTPTGFAGDPSSSADPTTSPTPSPTGPLTASPTTSPTASPTDSPTDSQTESPTGSPTGSPTDSTPPSATLTAEPTTGPTTAPSTTPPPASLSASATNLTAIPSATSSDSSADCVQNPPPYSGCALVATFQPVAQTEAEREYYEQQVAKNAGQPPLLAVLISGAGGS